MECSDYSKPSFFFAVGKLKCARARTGPATLNLTRPTFLVITSALSGDFLGML